MSEPAPPPPASADVRLPDAAAGNWVDRRAPGRLRPWLKLARLDRPAGAWLLLLPGWQGIALADAARGRAPDPRLLVLFAVGAVVMRSAGCAWNDFVDRDIDAKVARTALRPIPSGAIGPRQALAFVVACCLVGFAVLLCLRPAAIGLGVLSLGLVAAYPFMKRVTWWPQAWLGLTFNWGALMGWTAVRGRVEPAALLLYASGIAWTLGYDTIYAVQDLEDDALAGVKSSARRMGAAAPRGVALFYAASALFAVGAGWAALAGPLFYPAAAAFAAHLAVQSRRFRVEEPEGALRLFRSNRDAGLWLAAACALGAWRPG